MKKILIMLLAIGLMVQCCTGTCAFAEEGSSIFASHGLESRVQTLTEVSGAHRTNMNVTINGTDYTFKVTPYWGKIEFPAGHEAKCYVPDGVKKVESIRYDNPMRGMIDAVESKARAETEGEYEWRCITTAIKFFDAPKWAYNMYLANYYEDDGLWNRSFATTDLFGHGTASTHKVMWDGREQKIYSASTYYSSVGKRTVTVITMNYVPVGYDGVVVLLDNVTKSYPMPNAYADGDDFYNYVEDNTILYRVK